MKLFLRKLLGRITHLLAPSWLGSCLRCGVTWRWCDYHNTYYDGSNRAVVLCEHCWQELSIEDRKPYYRMQWYKWEVQGIHDHTGQVWHLIESAVERGE